MLKPGIYKHYKGSEYRFIGIAKHSETLEEHAVYQAISGNQALWVRPLSMFTETVEHEGERIQRFRWVRKGI